VKANTRRIYLDHAASTPVDPAVFEAMRPYLLEVYGNPSSQHSFGREARSAIDDARDAVSGAIGASSSEIYFTSGGTESDNLAVIGGARALSGRGMRVVISAAEHHAVFGASERLKAEGFEVAIAPVDAFGVVHPEALRDVMTPDTTLVSIIHANNEIGTLNKAADLADVAHEYGAVFHTDAVQSFGVVPVDVGSLGVDMLSVSAHKIYGPKGVGALYVRSGVRVDPLLHGGSQERERRPGTENLPGIVGFGAAAGLAVAMMEDASSRIRELRDYLESALIARIPDVRVNGYREDRVPGISNLAFPGAEREIMLLNLDLEGVAVSAGSACSAGAPEPSHVLEALGLGTEVVQSSLRFSVGRGTTRGEIDRVIDILQPIVERLRQNGQAGDRA
jgi:cysteine desulfurase